MITENKLKSIIIRVDPEMHKQLKCFVATKGTTLQDYVLNLIKKDLSTKE